MDCEIKTFSFLPWYALPGRFFHEATERATVPAWPPTMVRLQVVLLENRHVMSGFTRMHLRDPLMRDHTPGVTSLQRSCLNGDRTPDSRVLSPFGQDFQRVF